MGEEYCFLKIKKLELSWIEKHEGACLEKCLCLLLLLRRNTEVCPTEHPETSIDTGGACYVPSYIISLLIMQLLF